MYWIFSGPTATTTTTPTTPAASAATRRLCQDLNDPEPSPTTRLLTDPLHRRSCSADADAAVHKPPATATAAAAAAELVLTTCRLRSDSSATTTSGGDIELHTFGPYHRQNAPPSSSSSSSSSSSPPTTAITSAAQPRQSAPGFTVESTHSWRRSSNASSTSSWESRGVTFSEQRRSQQLWKGCW